MWHMLMRCLIDAFIYYIYIIFIYNKLYNPLWLLLSFHPKEELKGSI